MNLIFLKLAKVFKKIETFDLLEISAFRNSKVLIELAHSD
jgi:hypothetical protein